MKYSMLTHYIRICAKQGFIALLLIVMFGTQNVAALTEGDVYSFINNTAFYQPGCGSSSTDKTDDEATAGSIKPGPIYIMGDSITALAKKAYTSKFGAAGWQPTVEGLSSRQIEGGGPSPNGINQIKQDGDVIAKSNAIVIALGTNGISNPEATTAKQVTDLMNELKKVNTKDAPVFWVNVIDSKAGLDDDSVRTNKGIAEGVGENATIIDWYSEAKANANLASFNEGVHPGDKDIDLLVNKVYGDITKSAGNSSVATDDPSASGDAPAAAGEVTYRKAGNIPVSGKNVVATTFGGSYVGGSWGPSNDTQGVVAPRTRDDNGKGNTSKGIAGKTGYAELSISPGSGDYAALGGLPNFTKLLISYKGKSVVAEKLDVGAGGPEHPAIDLWWETAKLLDFTEGTGRVEIHVVPNSTPTTPVDGTAGTAVNVADSSQDTGEGTDACCDNGDGSVTASDGESTASGITSGTIKENLKNIFLFFTSHGYTKEQAAGIVGNIVAESGGDPLKAEGGKQTKSPPSTGGYGIVQWTPNSKILDYAKSVSKPAYELSTQLEFLLKQLNTTEKGAAAEIKSTTTAADAAKAFQGDSKIGGKYNGYERPLDEAASLGKRVGAAETALKDFGSLAGDSGSLGTSDTSSDGGQSCACTNSGTTTSLSGSLDSVLKDQLDKINGESSASVSTIDGKQTGSVNGDVQMQTRDSYKVFTAYMTMRAIEAGKLSWSSTIWDGNSVSETMTKMIVESNNDAAEALRTSSKIGLAAETTKVLQNDVGLSKKTVMGSGDYKSAAGTGTKSTSNDYVKFLTLLYKHKLPGVNKEGNYNKLIDLMKRATTDGGSARQGIAAGTSSDVADKPGWSSTAPTASNDVGIVYLKDNPYVIAIMTSEAQKWTGIAATAKAVESAIKSGGGAASAATDSAATASTASDCGGSDGAAAGDAAQTAINYAWPEYHKAVYKNMKPEYKAAVEAAQKAGQYVGSNGTPDAGIDCGGFVTTVMIASGVDKDYNNTKQYKGIVSAQHDYVKANSSKYTLVTPKTTADLKPGDIWFEAGDGHTLMYVGKHDGFNGIYASASTGGSSGAYWRAPMADSNGGLYTGGQWYRKN